MVLFSLVAFFGGILSILSPCSGALLPSYFALTFKKKDKLFLYTFVFSIGVVIVAIPIGIGAAFIFSFLSSYGPLLYKTMGLILMLFSVFTIFNLHLLKNLNLNLKFNNELGLFSTFLFGMFSSLSLGTCAGPILGAIATIAAGTQSPVKASVLMFFYTLGILVPFLLISYGVDRNSFLKRVFVKGRRFDFKIVGLNLSLHSTTFLSSVIFFIVGYIFFFHGGSLLAFQNTLNINFDFMLQLQENLLNLIY